jgi:hypothetical protein
VEFAVDAIQDIEWNTNAIDHLEIPPDRKDLVMSVVDSKLAGNADDGFDDVISGKGQGCNILLQYGALLQYLRLFANSSVAVHPASGKRSQPKLLQRSLRGLSMR